jgi:hypothetical protein
MLSGRELAGPFGNEPGQGLAETGHQLNVLETHHTGHPIEALDRLHGSYRRGLVRRRSGVVGVEPTVWDLTTDVMYSGIVGGDESPGLVTNPKGAGDRRARDGEVGQRSWSRSSA